jgi:hypothetical protein
MHVRSGFVLNPDEQQAAICLPGNVHFATSQWPRSAMRGDPRSFAAGVSNREDDVTEYQYHWASVTPITEANTPH